MSSIHVGPADINLWSSCQPRSWVHLWHLYAVISSQWYEWTRVWTLVLSQLLGFIPHCNDHVWGAWSNYFLSCDGLWYCCQWAACSVSCYVNCHTLYVRRRVWVHCTTILCAFLFASCSELLRKPNVKQKFQHLITNSFVQDNHNLKWCPAPGCPNALLASNVDHAPVTCSCGHSFW